HNDLSLILHNIYLLFKNCCVVMACLCYILGIHLVVDVVKDSETIGALTHDAFSTVRPEAVISSASN
ncbi:MAG: hypothetical protein J5509_10550, partial [Lachnospiraceae bacterium]|nr:hypothetical protein [Lachnospiraceae bacterium]